MFFLSLSLLTMISKFSLFLLLTFTFSTSTSSSPSLLSSSLTCTNPSLPLSGPVYTLTTTNGTPLFSNSVPLSIFFNGTWTTNQFLLTKAVNVSGNDGLGFYVGTECTYSLSSSPTISFVTVAAYTYASAVASPDASIVRYRYSFPNGAHQTNHTTGPNSAYSTVSTFPAFAGPGSTLLPNILTWNGPFFAPANDVPSMFSQRASVVLYYGGDVSNQAVVLSPLDHFLNANIGNDLSGTGTSLSCANKDPGCWVAGVSSTVTSLPPGFTHSFILTTTSTGISSTMDAWGKILRGYYGATSQKLQDISLSTIGYQTDNGAQLCFGCGEPLDECLLNEKAYLDNISVPIQYLSFQNAWWEAGAESAPWCVGEWVPVPAKVPMGIQTFQQKLGLPLQLYAPYFCASSAYPSNFTMIRSDPTLPGCNDFDFYDAAPEESRAFYEFLFDLGQDYGMTMFEPDFLNANHLCVPRFIEEIGAADAFFAGQTGVALDRGIPIQWCFATPMVLLWTLGQPAVTNFRVSYDYYYGSSWDIGRSSLLVWAAGGAPSKDTFWTSDNGNQSTTRGGCDKTGCPPDHSSTAAILHTMLAVLSTGPVGFSDAPGETDRDLLMRTCDACGNLLQPSKPLTAVDSTHDVTGNAPSGYVLITHTAVNSNIWLYMVVSHQMDPTKAMFTLRNLDMYPTLSAGTTYGIVTWQNLQLCAPGLQSIASTNNCNVTTFTATADPHTSIIALPVPAKGEDPYTPTLTLIAPQCSSSGTVFFGEMDKFASLSVQRFTSITCTSNGLSLSLSGLVGETIRVAWWNAINGVSVQNVTFNNKGPAPRVSLACTLVAGNLSCQ